MFEIFSGAKDPQKAVEKAHEYVRDGKVGSAIKILENNQTDGEDSFDLYLTLARLYFEIEERTRAVNTLRQLKTIVPQKTDEIVAVLSELYFQHPSIDSADFLLELYIEQERYEELMKTLRNLSEREMKLLITRFEKIKQSLDEKKVVSAKDCEQMVVLATLQFYVGDSEKALDAIDPMIDIEIYRPKLLKWAQIICRERYNDWYALQLLIRVQLATQEFNAALVQAQRAAEKFPDSVDTLIAMISSATPPGDLEASFTQFLTDLYIKKGDLDASTDRLLDMLQKDTKKVDDVIRGLRELERINPKDVKILYALGDTYLTAHRVSLAVAEYEKILEIAPDEIKTVMTKFQEAFAQEPNNSEVIDSLVRIYLKQNDEDAAVSVIRKAYESDPALYDDYLVNLNSILEKDLDNPEALELLGLCYAHRGDHESAVVVFENLMDRGSYGQVYHATDILHQKYPDLAAYLNLKARSMVARDEADKALDLLTQHLKRHPDSTELLLPTLDTIVSQRPDLGKYILPIYEQYMKEEPFVGELSLARGRAFAGEYEKSVEIFERLYELSEDKDTVKRALIEVIRERTQAVPLLLAAARIFMKENEVEIATQFFKTAQRVDPKTFFKIVDEFYDVLKSFPKDREVRILLVDTFFEQNIWDRVIEESKRAIEVFGKESQYFKLKLGEALVEKGNLTDAVRPLMLSLDGSADYSDEVLTYLDKILSIDKSNVPAHFARGRALSAANRINEAVEEYLLTARILPARADYILEAMKALSKKAVANPLVLFALGSIELTLKRHDDAIKHLLQSCELDAGLSKRTMPLYERLGEIAPSPLLHFSLAKVYRVAGLTDSAVQYYMKAHAEAKEYREPAISEMKKICADNPHDVASRKGLAEMYFNYNNLEDALDLVKEVVLTASHENDWAKEFIERILKENAQHVPSYFALGKIYVNEGCQDRAIEVYRELLQIAPSELTNVISALEGITEKQGVVLLFLGRIYAAVGDTAKSLSLFDELFTQDSSAADAIVRELHHILEKNAKIVGAHLLLHRVFMHEKKYEQALGAIERAQGLVPDSKEIILKKGHALYEMGDADRAIKLYTELLQTTEDRAAIYRLIKETRARYFNEKLELTQGEADDDRLSRAHLYIVMDQPDMAEKELQFTPRNASVRKRHTLLRAHVCLMNNRPIDALEMMKDLPTDRETAPTYADIYDALGSYEVAALVLRQTGAKGMEQRIATYEKRAQERRLAKGRYFVEGRSR
ncbi:hypothetical protein AMJ87_07305 [candidate division WOR_3 bacterium SM23_60]|uniref:Tetratricopeptide repeat protein n=1 Tax=candidate division WOR_3 bacterium SM23_60 TaxID=1703780 RepID=A0A0S8GIE7_UNCW3|nr:MAG: hypothetical protein AMJ87_07305 [candidate division WOR_3 bacterium SM23_60]